MHTGGSGHGKNSNAVQGTNASPRTGLNRLNRAKRNACQTIEASGPPLQAAWHAFEEEEWIDSAGSLLPNLRENRLRHPEGGLSQFSNRVIENDESGLIGLIEDGERARNLEPSAKRFLPARLLIDEHHVGMHLSCERDRFSLSEVELWQDQTALGTQNFQPPGWVVGPVSHRLRSQGMLQLCQYSGWNQNSLV